MKKAITIFLTFSVIIGLFQSISAQQAITHSLFPSKITKTIVKEHFFPNTVSYIETIDAHYFAYADASMQIYYHKIDSNIFVQDFKIKDDVVYFCGYDISTGCTGVWGYFDISGLTTTNLQYKIFSNFVCSKQYVDTLHSLVVYDIQGSNHIVTVGTTTDGSSIKNGCTIDITPVPGNMDSWNYTIGVTPDGTQEILKYVCETDNLVVTAGSYANAPNIESYRVHYKSNIFSTGGPQDFISHFPFSTWQPYTRNPYKFAVTHMYGDVMAMALQSYRYDNGNYYVLFYEYDMSTLTNGVNTTINSLAVPTYSYPLDVEGLVYSINTNSLSVLVTSNLPTFPLYGNCSIVAEITPGNTYTTLHPLTNIKLHSIDNYNSQHNFLCLGADISIPQLAFFYTQLNNNSFNCVTNPTFYGSDPTFTTKQDKCPYVLCSGSFKCGEIKSVILYTSNNDINCE